MSQTFLYSTPPTFLERDERRETHDYGLIHMVSTITKLRCFDAVVHFLRPSEAGRLQQTRKIFVLPVEKAVEQVVMHLHEKNFSHLPLPSNIGLNSEEEESISFIRYLHNLFTDKSQKILLMGGYGGQRATNRVDMMIINSDGSISWEICKFMFRKRHKFSAIYHKGQVLAISSGNYTGADGQASCEKYDVLSQTAVELREVPPIHNLNGVSIAELNGKAYVIGGVYSDRVFCFDIKKNLGRNGSWIEQEAKIIIDRSHAAVATYQNKIWLAGGRDCDGEYLSNIEVYDPLMDSWHIASNLSMNRSGTIGLFVINENMYAVGCTSKINVLWIEKYDQLTCTWNLLSKTYDGDRFNCAFVACGDKIYFFGGSSSSKESTSWNSFDTRNKTWASQEGQYKNVAMRQIPKNFSDGQALCITPSEQLLALSNWTSYPDFMNKEEEA